MTRGIRGATTIKFNDKDEILTNTKLLIKEMANKNNVIPEMISHVLISVTKEVNAGFPAQALRQIEGWTYVPVMCMNEIAVPNSLEKCIRIMMIVKTDMEQQEIQHIFHNEAVQLRPDLIQKQGG